MSDPTTAVAGVTAGGITVLGVATGLAPELMLAGAAGGWWSLSYQPACRVLSRLNRVLLSALVAAWVTPIITSLDIMPAAVPEAPLRLGTALMLGLATVDVLGYGVLEAVRLRFSRTQEK